MRNHSSSGVIALVLISSALSACGTKGPLYIPQPVPKPATAPAGTPAAAPQQTAPDDNSRPTGGAAR